MDDRSGRNRQEATTTRLDQIGSGAIDRSTPIVAQTCKVTTYPTSANVQYGCFTVGIGGVEGEGKAFTTTVGTAVFFATNIGSAIPPIGTNVLAYSSDGRWVFRFDGPTS